MLTIRPQPRSRIPAAERPRQQERRAEVDGDGQVELLDRRLLDRLLDEDRGVVDEDVDTARRRASSPSIAVRRGEVGADRRASSGPRSCSMTSTPMTAMAGGGKDVGDRPSDAPGAARHECERWVISSLLRVTPSSRAGQPTAPTGGSGAADPRGTRRRCASPSPIIARARRAWRSRCAAGRRSSAATAARHVGVRIRLDVLDVQPGRADPALAQGPGQGRFVDDSATGGVDECGRRLHQAQLALADQVARLRRRRDVERDDVALAEQVIERDPARPLGVAGRPAVVDDRHAEPGRPTCDGLADLPVADDPERRTMDVVAQEQVEVVLRATIRRGGSAPPRSSGDAGGDDEPERQVGCGLVQGSARVRDWRCRACRRRDARSSRSRYSRARRAEGPGTRSKNAPSIRRR